MGNDAKKQQLQSLRDLLNKNGEKIRALEGSVRHRFVVVDRGPGAENAFVIFPRLQLCPSCEQELSLAMLRGSWHMRRMRDWPMQHGPCHQG